MSTDNTTLEEQFPLLLAACDEALAAGAPLPEEAIPAELRPRLEREVAWCRRVRRLWSGGDPGAASTAPSAPRTAPVASLTSLGRFEIRRELGRGTFGVVLLAYDP